MRALVFSLCFAMLSVGNGSQAQTAAPASSGAPGQPGPNPVMARLNLNHGVQAYKDAKYDVAIADFRKAAQFDPSLVEAPLFLATAYANQYVPGVDTPDNNRYADEAISNFKQVLTMNSSREQQIGCLKNIASVYFNMKRLDDARQWDEEALKLDPNDVETYYTIGVIEWTLAYKDATDIKAKAGHKVDDDIIGDTALCSEVRQANQQRVADGMEMFRKALELRSDHDDAMAYTNLMYRRKADIDCGDPAAHDADLKTADDWVRKTLETKKRKQSSTNPNQ